ncbi:SDR family NAD(P)-dependent oxidoreductase [Terricaulis silvestris]|uniref:D-xylose 1-dehydrogenase n=1 Tax=Terricaulis silvestris TaxID=2686094 RepID=A0A6I6MPV1_9CAUL|nr:SDR family oxidoreductase [Terricaulis silvestris]QGZ93552.1 Levodione reductase [Terricaulis silvestris]
MSGRFSGKIALITGAASGIGAAFARLAVAEGAEGLALLDRDSNRLSALAEVLERPTVLAGGDVGDVALWADFEARIGARFGRIELALANAGIGHPMMPIAELEPEMWSRVINVNLTGAFLTLRTALRLMNDDGAIVLVSSSMGVKPSPNTAGYGASKAALIHLAKIAALEAAPRGIRVNAIAPGGVETPLFRDADFFKGLIKQTGSERSAFDTLASRTPLGRYASAEETAGLIAFLMSDAAAQVTGANFVADAGMTL